MVAKTKAAWGNTYWAAGLAISFSCFLSPIALNLSPPFTSETSEIHFQFSKMPIAILINF
jgi:hypothetical protein